MRGSMSFPAKCLALSVLLCAVAGAHPAGESPEPAFRAGGTWGTQTSGVATTLTGVAFVDSLRGFAVGSGGVVRRCLDGGITAGSWTAQTNPVTANLTAVAMGTPNSGAAVADNNEIINTSNGVNVGGSTWASSVTGNLTAVAAADDSTAWTVGSKGAFRLTTDGGNSWPKRSGGTGSDLRAVHFQNFTEGYSVGAAGIVRVTVDGSTWTTPGAGTIGVAATVNGISMVPGTTTPNAVGWAVGSGATIRKTIDSAVNWTSPGANAATQDLNSVYAGDANNAWAAGNSGQIVATSNGGANWDLQTSNAGTSNLFGVSFINFGTWKGIAVGAGGMVVWTADGGATWTAGTSTVVTPLRAVHVRHANLAIAVGDNGTILKSTDGGANWTVKGAGTTIETLNGVKMGTNLVGWAAGNSGTLLKTEDAGETWSVQVSHLSGPVSLNDVKFGNIVTALAVGAGGAILKTTNAGVHWVRKMNGAANWTASTLNSVSFGSSAVAWAVGDAGTMLRTDNGGETWVSLAAVTPDPLYSITALSDALFVAVGGAPGHGTVVVITFNTSTSTWSAASSAVGTAPLRGVAFPKYSRRGYAVGDGGQVWVTTSAGSAWEAESSGVLTSLRAVAFPCQTLGWAVGDGGTILRRDGSPPLLSFPPHVGTPYTYQPPLIDGFINPELSETRRPDTGWDRAAEVTFANGTVQPPVTFMGLRRNSGGYLYFGFEARSDDAFDDDDAIVILLRPNAAVPRPEHTDLDRRLIIHPLTTGTGSPAGAIVAPGYVAPSYSPNNENGTYRTLDVYSWDSGSNDWHSIPTHAELQVLVRSWVPSAGNFCWSVEIQVPLSNAVYTDWINIGTDFLFSFYVLQKNTGGVLEASWPRDLVLSGPADLVAASMPACDWGQAKLGSANDGVGVRIKVPSYTNIGTNTSGGVGALEHQIHGTATNTFVAKVQNSGDTPADNVSALFRIANWGVNGGDPSSGAWTKVPVTSGSNPPAAATIPAQSLGVPGEATFQFDWLLSAPEKLAYAAPHDHQCVQVSLSSTGNVNFTERSAWVNMQYVPTSLFKETAFVTAQGFGHHGAKNGVQRFYLHVMSERFDFHPAKVPLEVVKKPDLKKDGQSERKDAHPYYDGENLKRVRLHERFPSLKSEKGPAGFLTWQTHGLRETTNTVKIRGHVYPILEQMNGFGYVARHGNEVSDWTAGLNGAVVKKLSDYVYQVDVPVNGAAPMDAQIESHEGGLGATSTRGGLMGLILLILLFLIIIFWFLKKKP